MNSPMTQLAYLYEPAMLQNTPSSSIIGPGFPLLPDTSDLMIWLPLSLIAFCIISFSVSFYMHTKNKKITLFIPISMLVISICLALLFLVPLPLQKSCYFSPVDETPTDCKSLYMTAWTRFLNFSRYNDKRYFVPKPDGIFVTNTVD
jgi:hypothetical protein